QACFFSNLLHARRGLCSTVGSDRLMMMMMIKYSMIINCFVTGMRVIFDGARPVNNRVVNATIRCNYCDIPTYAPLDPNKYYKVVSQSFIGGGGDGFSMISNNRQNVEVLGVDYDILLRYVRHQSPIMKDLDGRILIKDPCLEN
ncbi:putative apyrase, partial [Danaus plexippus plexippus]